MTTERRWTPYEWLDGADWDRWWGVFSLFDEAAAVEQVVEKAAERDGDVGVYPRPPTLWRLATQPGAWPRAVQRLARRRGGPRRPRRRRRACRAGGRPGLRDRRGDRGGGLPPGGDDRGAGASRRAVEDGRRGGAAGGVRGDRRPPARGLHLRRTAVARRAGRSFCLFCVDGSWAPRASRTEDGDDDEGAGPAAAAGSSRRAGSPAGVRAPCIMRSAVARKRLAG